MRVEGIAAAVVLLLIATLLATITDAALAIATFFSTCN